MLLIKKIDKLIQLLIKPYIMEQSIKDYCYDYWVSGNIVDASTFKIYQNDKLVYDSSVDSKRVYVNIEIEGLDEVSSVNNVTKPVDISNYNIFKSAIL